MDINLFFMSILVVCNLITTAITIKSVMNKKSEEKVEKTKFFHAA